MTEEALRQQTEMFWFLQLQFMEMPSYELIQVFNSVQVSLLYKISKFTEKLNYITNQTYELTEEQHNCLATHIALQLAGIEE